MAIYDRQTLRPSASKPAMQGLGVGISEMKYSTGPKMCVDPIVPLERAAC